MTRFDYLIDKIETAEFIQTPFKHLEILQFFTDADFAELLACQEIAIPTAANDEELFDHLLDRGYKIIPFPGSTASRQEYLAWHQNQTEGDRYHPTCEGFGVTLRLIEPISTFLQELDAFLRGDAFNAAIAKKFNINLESCSTDCGIQKYLDGYEITPHPDVRFKALTYMVNANPNPDSATQQHHTHYMRFSDKRRYVETLWSGNQDIQRCWEPWEWCETEKVQSVNNSIVIFSPNNDTIHAVKATYDHLAFQRTQLYGNLWYKNRPAVQKAEWTDLDVFANMTTRMANADPEKPIQKNKMSAIQPDEQSLVAHKTL
ncbi:hypothetical protein [Pelagimonas varians]|uniref:hypothetical protein n=1 Tax=Pelagimonas varians TaxID=696760 RepID=UPI0011425AEA|nr:hypothetical protein [Pelagimonas varians]